MTIHDLPYAERHTIERAREILARYEQDEAQRYVETHEIRPSLHNIVYFGAYIEGARAMLERISADTHGHLHLSGFRDKEGKVYDAAIVRLIGQDKRHINMYLTNSHEIMFRNHQKDKKGRLISVEAYFAKRVVTMVEAE